MGYIVTPTHCSVLVITAEEEIQQSSVDNAMLDHRPVCVCVCVWDVYVCVGCVCVGGYCTHF